MNNIELNTNESSYADAERIAENNIATQLHLFLTRLRIISLPRAELCLGYNHKQLKMAAERLVLEGFAKRPKPWKDMSKEDIEDMDIYEIQY